MALSSGQAAHQQKPKGSCPPAEPVWGNSCHRQKPVEAQRLVTDLGIELPVILQRAQIFDFAAGNLLYGKAFASDLN